MRQVDIEAIGHSEAAAQIFAQKERMRCREGGEILDTYGDR